MPAPNLNISSEGGITNMVKCLKSTNKTRRRRRRQRSGRIFIYYISKQAGIIGDERKCKPLCTILLQSWQDRNETIPKYAA